MPPKHLIGFLWANCFPLCTRIPHIYIYIFLQETKWKSPNNKIKKHELFKGGIILFAEPVSRPGLHRVSSSLNLTAGLRAAPFPPLSLFFLIYPPGSLRDKLKKHIFSGISWLRGLDPGHCPLNYSPWLPTSCSACSVGNCFGFAAQTCKNIFLLHFRPSGVLTACRQAICFASESGFCCSHSFHLNLNCKLYR